MRSTPPRRPSFALFAAFLLVLLAPAGLAGEAEDDTKTAPETVEVRRRPFTVGLERSGTFVPRGAVEVAYRPEVYGGVLEVVLSAKPGFVVAGQELVRFDDEVIRREIQNAESALYIARARLEKQQADLQGKKASSELQRARLESRRARAERAVVLFLEVHEPMRTAQSEHNLQGTDNRIQDRVEELAQLEKMYEADDLTEETEEIVLRRARRDLARSRRSFEWQKQRQGLLVEVTLPNEKSDLEYDLQRKKNELQTFLATSTPDLRRAELEFEKSRADFEYQEKRLRDLRADRDALRVRAPRDGYAVPGAFKGTSWQDIAGMRRALEPGNRLKVRQVLFTIVRPGDVGVHATVGEADLGKLKVSQRVVVHPGVDAQRTLDGAISEVLRVGSGGKYAVRIDLEETDEVLMPGSSAKLDIVIRREEEALVVPADAVQKDGEQCRVFVWADDEVAPREVKTGATVEGRTEILEGLEEGERILPRPPEATK